MSAIPRTFYLTILLNIFLLGSCSSIESLFEQTEVTPQPRPVLKLEVAPPTVTFISVPSIQPQLSRLAAPNLWGEIIANFALDAHLDEKRVQQEIRWFKRHPDYLPRISKRAEKYLAYIHQEVTARGMPGEIALLPIVESALDPYAFSPGGASGLWQFVPASARRFKVSSNWWFEGRRDPVQATRGALDYLEILYRRFDDWLLALAAYNTGEGNISKALRRHGGSPTFWQIKVHRETASYVPRLLALATILKEKRAQQSVRHNSIGDHSENHLATIAPGPSFAIVALPSQYDIGTAAGILKVSPQFIYDWNPGLNQWATPAGGPHRLLLPHHLSPYFEELQQLPAQDRLAWQRYQIKTGDTLGEIALKFSTDAASLRRANNIKGNQIRAGKHLLIPTSGKKSAPNRRGHSIDYVVRTGDSLWKIAQTHQVSLNALMRLNETGPKDILRRGQHLKLPRSDNSQGPEIKTRKVTYRVRKGDSLARIATKFSVAIADITRWNSIDLKGYLQPGQKLILYIESVVR